MSSPTPAPPNRAGPNYAAAVEVRPCMISLEPVTVSAGGAHGPLPGNRMAWVRPSRVLFVARHELIIMLLMIKRSRPVDSSSH